MKHELTDRFLRSLEKPSTGRVEVSDTKRAGLRFRLTSMGRTSWMFEKRIKDGPKRKHTLGNWPGMSLAEARAIALEIEAEAAKGIDRVANAKEARQRAEAAAASLVTTGAVIDAYQRLHLSTLRRGDERSRQLRTALGKHISWPVGDISRKDMQAVIDAKAQEGRLVMANRLKSALCAFTRWAWQRGYTDNDEGAGLTKAAKEKARERVLSIEEVQRIYQASFDVGPLWGPMFRMLILTAQRRNEILNLRWDEIDLTARTITKAGSQTKNGKPHVTHLSDAAIETLGSVERKSKLVFTTTGITPVSGITKAKRKLNDLLGDGQEHWRIHDLRTAMATAMAQSGEPEAVVDRILNHSASGSAPSAVARVYNQAELLPQRARVLDNWADIVTGEVAEVVQLHG